MEIFKKPCRVLPAEPVIIGIVGTSRGAGATHLAVVMANYESGVHRRRCAVLEWNSHGDFARMERACIGRTSTGPFTVFGTDYFRKSGKEELLSCMRKGYERIIIDFGRSFVQNKADFLRCHKKYVVCGLAEWQIEGLKEFMDCMKGEPERKSWEYGAVFGNEETRREMTKRFHCNIRRIPPSVDPFALKREAIAFFEK